MKLRNEICVGFMVAVALGCGSKQSDDDDRSGGSGGTGASGGAEVGGGSGGTATGGTSTGGTSTGGTSTGGTSTGGTSTGGTSTGGTSTGGTSDGGTAAGSGGGSAGKTAGAGGAMAGSSAGGSAGASPTGTCANTFGTPALLVPDTPGVLRQSLSVTGDDLELYYEERRDGDNSAHLMVRTRTDRSSDFGSPTELDSSIWAWCLPIVDPSIDVSDDGLRLYLTCVDTSTHNADGGFTSSAVRVADRPTRSAAFSLNPMTYGTANVSFAVSQDELTAVWSDYSTSTTPFAVMAVRTSKSDPFGVDTGIPGITDSLRNPELANDGLHLFGSVQANDMGFHIVMYSRPTPSGAFAPLTTEDLVIQHSEAIQDDPNTSALEGVFDYTPTVSGDCKSLYFMRRTVLSGASPTSEIFVAKR